MKTIIYSQSHDLTIPAQIIQNGGIVACPTETVYGLCANALNETAVSNIFKAKGRPSDNPLIVHIASIDMLDQLVKDISPMAQALIDKFWPGPLTLIFNSTNVVPAIVRAGLATVAIRFPSHPIMQILIKQANVPIAAPSANVSGKPSPTNARRVIEDMDTKIDAIIDGGSCEFGVESTVVDTTRELPIILRPGVITAQMITEVVGNIKTDSFDKTPISPGMKYTHYSPNAKVIIVTGDNAIKTISNLVKANPTAGVLLPQEYKEQFINIPYISLGSENDLAQIASVLFEKLREVDDLGLESVYTIYLPQVDIGEAIMNRLIKACGNNIIFAGG
ncbi:MAG: hypothetical protein ATN34_02435 [Epulopiscium sp. Nele67-Bin002]|nr:MAG: threonylcarbamoyl-AMP synthase [Epulopiscium sp. Nele67-Bin001]OON92619.1 MAG: hypothetical protein ATN34_02435 [Epulopiscium sp. Nele67-Bin002]